MTASARHDLHKQFGKEKRTKRPSSESLQARESHDRQAIKFIHLTRSSSGVISQLEEARTRKQTSQITMHLIMRGTVGCSRLGLVIASPGVMLQYYEESLSTLLIFCRDQIRALFSPRSRLHIGYFHWTYMIYRTMQRRNRIGMTTKMS
jgi:hypothetical protein